MPGASSPGLQVQLLFTTDPHAEPHGSNPSRLQIKRKPLKHYVSVSTHANCFSHWNSSCRLRGASIWLGPLAVAMTYCSMECVSLCFASNKFVTESPASA